MRLALISVVLGLTACQPPLGSPHTAAQWQACEGSTGFDVNGRIRACSAVATDTDADPTRRAAALVQRGMLRADYGQQARAVADFGRALRLDRTLADAYVERGLVHHERGAYDIAVRDFDAALAIDPNIPLAIASREQALTGRVTAFQAQLEQLNQVLAREPTNIAMLNNRCWLRAINDDDLDAALLDCNAALAGQPGYAAALDSRGMVRLKRNEFAVAVEDYNAALAVEPGRGHYLYGRGIARLRLGEVAEGQADLIAAEAAEPGIAANYAGWGVRP